MSLPQRGQRFKSSSPQPPDERGQKHTVVIFGSVSLVLSLMVLVAAVVMPTHTVSSKPHSTQDRAAFANGGRIIDSYTSASIPSPLEGLYETAEADDRIGYLVRQSEGPASKPENALGVVPDRRGLWFFNGTRGTIGVRLSAPTNVRVVELKGHPVPRRCLPRDFNVWGLVVPTEVQKLDPTQLPWETFPKELEVRVTVETPRSFSLFGSRPTPHWYPLGHVRDAPRNKAGNEFIPTPAILEAHVPVHVLAVEFLRNWGETYTCFAGLGVYGAPDSKST